MIEFAIICILAGLVLRRRNRRSNRAACPPPHRESVRALLRRFCQQEVKLRHYRQLLAAKERRRNR